MSASERTTHPVPSGQVQTIDVGFVHTLTVPGGPCRPDCPHPQHKTDDAEEHDD